MKMQGCYYTVLIFFIMFAVLFQAAHDQSAWAEEVGLGKKYTLLPDYALPLYGQEAFLGPTLLVLPEDSSAEICRSMYLNQEISSSDGFSLNMADFGLAWTYDNRLTLRADYSGSNQEQPLDEIDDYRGTKSLARLSAVFYWGNQVVNPYMDIKSFSFFFGPEGTQSTQFGLEHRWKNFFGQPELSLVQAWSIVRGQEACGDNEDRFIRAVIQIGYTINRDGQKIVLSPELRWVRPVEFTLITEREYQVYGLNVSYNF